MTPPSRPTSSPLPRLAEIVAALVQAQSAEAAFDIALDATMAGAGADMGAIFRPAGTSLRLRQSRNLPQAFRKRPPLLDMHKWAAQAFVRAPGHDAAAAPLDEAAQLAGIQTWASMPVVVRGTVHGLLLIASRDLVGFSPDAIAHLEITANVLGLTLESPASTPDGPPPVPTTVGPAPDDPLSRGG